MKPKTIVLIRHGQSEGNVNKKIYKTTPDYALHLTDVGIQQAKQVGIDLHYMVGDELPYFYVSPFWRTRETYREIVKAWGITDYENQNYYEDPRLREQEWHGKLPADGEDNNDMEDERDAFGHFYYRFKSGESCADTFDRVSDVMNTVHRDFEKKNFPSTAVFVTHGMTIRVFLMRWFHMTVEKFEALANPKNCEMIILNLNSENKYELVTPLKTHVLKHKYQFDWGK